MPAIGPFGFVGGWNTKASPFTLPKDQMSDAQDIQIIYGDLQKRGGSAYINSSVISGTPAVHGVADWQTPAGQRYLVVTAGTKIFQTADLGATLTDITGAVSITSGANQQSNFASLNGILARTAPTDAPIQWNGTGNAAALAGSPPTTSLCAVANNFMFLSGNTTNPSRVYWSNVSDPGTWGAANNIDFKLGDGDKVTALSTFNQNLLIFKRRSIGLLWTQQNTVSGSVTLAPLTQISAPIGCPGPLCVDVMPDGRVAFLGTNGHCYIFDGSSCMDISDPKYPKSNVQPTFDAINVARLQYACVKVYPTRNQIWFSVSSGSNTSNNVVYVYDYILEAWQSPFTGIAANVMTTSIDTRGSPSHPIILVTGTYGGFVTEQDKGTTNAENSDSHIDGWGTISIQVGQGQTDFIPRSVIVPYEAQTAGQLQFGYGFNAYTDISTTTQLSESQGGATLDNNFFLDQSTLAGPATLRTVVPVVSTGRTFSMQMQFRNQFASQPFTVHPVFISNEVEI